MRAPKTISSQLGMALRVRFGALAAGAGSGVAGPLDSNPASGVSGAAFAQVGEVRVGRSTPVSSAMIGDTGVPGVDGA